MVSWPLLVFLFGPYPDSAGLSQRFLTMLRAALALALLLAAPLAPARSASLDGIAVEVKNESEPVLCAEKDNVALSFASKDVRSFRIEAAHPVYLAPGMRDNWEADWTACDMSADPVRSAPGAPGRFTHLRRDRDVGRRLPLPDLLAAGHRRRPHRRPRREGPAPDPGVDAAHRWAPRRCWCSIRRTATGARGRLLPAACATPPTARRSSSARSRSRAARSSS